MHFIRENIFSGNLDLREILCIKLTFPFFGGVGGV